MSVPIPYFINGRFLTKKITGTERFAHELVKALDRELSETHSSLNITLVAPKGTPEPQGLQHINFLPYGKRQGHLWEQTDLAWITRKGFLINPGSCGPLFKRKQLTIIHDAAVYRQPHNFSFAYRTWHQMMGRLLSKSSRLGTVSAFSQKELAAVLHVPHQSICVIPNGHEHILTITPDPSIIEKLRLQNRPYFLFVGSPTPSKNLLRAIQAFEQIGKEDVVFVTVGAAKQGLFRNELGALPTNVLMPGRLTDQEIVALYKNALALVFPSLYEGFGIPPLEAMAHGCPVLASRIKAIEEVCADAALYFDPLQPNEIAERMRELLNDPDLRQQRITKGYQRYPYFSWKKSAQGILGVINAN